MMNEPIKSIMTTNPVCLQVDSSLADVIQIFANQRIHHLPVVDNKRLVGLITTYDLWRQDAPLEQYATIAVSDVMTERVVKLSPDDKIGTAAELFLDKRIHALPIVDQGNLVGIVTSFDVLRYEFKKEYKSAILYKDVLEPRPRASA